MPLNYRYFKYIVSLAGACISICVNLIILRVWQGPCGFDVYYYALQTKALALAGAQLFSDHSPVYRVLYLVNCLLQNPVLSVQVLSSFSIAVMYFCLLIISFRGGISLYKIAAATIAVFNPATFYLMLEFTKNSFAFALFFLSWVLLTNEQNRIAIDFKNILSVIRLFLGLLFLGLSAFSHRLMLALFLCFVIQGIIMRLWPRVKAREVGQILKILIPALAIILLAIIGVGIYLWDMIAERLSIIRADAPLGRMTQFIRSSLLPGEHVFYVVIQVAVFFLVPALVIIRRQFYRRGTSAQLGLGGRFKPEVIFAAVAWLFLFPFLQFGWNEVGFRLLILSSLMLGPWLISLNPKIPGDKDITARVVAIVFFAASIWFTSESVLNLAAEKGPDYRALNKDFASIEDHVKNRRLIAHRGLAGFLWYEKGIRSENFLPVDKPEKYLRLVYAFSPDILEFYLEPGDPLPIPINRTYMLIEEYIWQRFYMDRQDLYFLQSELNPFLPRPVTAFAINEDVAAMLSPISDPP